MSPSEALYRLSRELVSVVGAVLSPTRSIRSPSRSPIVRSPDLRDASTTARFAGVVGMGGA
eukprot:7796547-Alexandrium_andersonii.AAC.1